MENKEATNRLQKIEEQLKEEEENYYKALKQKKDYNTLKTIRTAISNLKNELKQLLKGDWPNQHA